MTIYSSLFAAPITHYFYSTLQTIFGPNVVAKVLVDRLVFCPIFVFFTLYILDRLQVCLFPLPLVDRSCYLELLTVTARAR